MANPLNPFGRGAARWLYYYGPHFMSSDDEINVTHGIFRDAPTNAIPNGYLYDASDVLVNEPGLIRKRGGTSYAGPAMTAATYGASVAYAEFPAGSQLVGIGNNGHLYTVTSGTTTDIATLGTGFPPLDKPKLKIGGGKNLLIIPASDGSTAPKTYDGTTVATLGGTPPGGKFVEIYKSRVLLGNTAANPNRLFFSPTPDPTTTWDTTNSWIDFDYPITGMAAIANAVIVFSSGHTERLTGATPPPNSDMDRAPVGAMGCTDARSIVVYRDSVIFANPHGVYITNGSSFDSLTDGRISTFWRNLFVLGGGGGGYNPATWTISAGLYGHEWLFVSVLDSLGGIQQSFLCYLPTRAWTTISIGARMFARSTGTTDELYFAETSTNRITALSGIFKPTDANRFEANGVSVIPSVTYRMIGWTPGLQAFGNGRLSYKMQAGSTGAPTLNVSIQTKVGDDANSGFALVPESPLAATSAVTDTTSRQKLTIGKDGHGLHVKITGTDASALTEIYGLEIEHRPYPQTKGG